MFCEPFARCRPATHPSDRNIGPVQTIQLSMVSAVLAHKRDNLVTPETYSIFDGKRHNRVRALQPYTTAQSRAAFYKEHEEFVGQGYWRGLTVAF